VAQGEGPEFKPQTTHTHTRDHFIYIAKPNDRIVQARVRRKGKKYEPEFILEEF
jgi:hypothetical protein